MIGNIMVYILKAYEDKTSVGYKVLSAIVSKLLRHSTFRHLCFFFLKAIKPVFPSYF